MKKSQKIMWFVIGVFALIYGIYEVVTFDEQLLENPEFQETLSEWNDASYNLLEICMNTDNLIDLEGCKSDVGIPSIIEGCKINPQSTTSVCSEPRLNEFFVNIDQRINSAQENIESLEQNLSELEEKLETILQIPNFLFVSQSSGEVIVDDYPALMRACIRYQTSVNEIGMPESGLEMTEGMSYLLEDLGICRAKLNAVQVHCKVLEICSGYEKIE